MERERPPPPEGYVEALVDRIRATANQMNVANRMVREGQEMQASAEADFGRIQGAAELYNIDLMAELKRRFEADGGPTAPEAVAPPTAFSNERPTVLEFVLERAAAAFPEPVRASDLRRDYERQYGQKVHEKTFGMTLYRASQSNPPQVRREGRADWFFIPEELRRHVVEALYQPPGAEHIGEDDALT